MLKIAICDDDKSELFMVKKTICERLNQANIDTEIYLFNNSSQLLKDKNIEEFDLIFLDIDMPEIDGMGVAERLNDANSASEIVFVTNHDELVYKAYRFKALGFVRKKYLESEMSEILTIFLELIERNRKTILLNVGGVEKKINIHKIIYFQSDDHYVHIFFDDGNKQLVRESIKNMESTLSKFGFIRIHSRYLVNYNYIFSIEKNVIVLDNNKQLPISRSNVIRTKEMFQFFSRRG